jgi:hypothetical protein
MVVAAEPQAKDLKRWRKIAKTNLKNRLCYLPPSPITVFS